MVAPALNNYEYQYKDSGFKLNGSVATLPFIAVSKVQGLDMPEIEEDIEEYDAQHGGYGYARFVNTRIIIITGTLYADVLQVDAVLDTLKTNFMPSDTEYPFYFKGTGITQRYFMCKSLGIKYDVDRLRSIGSSPIQIQLFAGDPIAYVDNADVVITSGTSGSLVNDGNVATSPVVELVGPATVTSIIKESTGETVTLTYTTDADDQVIVDFKNHRCDINGVNSSINLTALGWWTIDPAGTTNFRVVSKGVDIMTNGNCEANFGAGYAVGANWTGTQQSTEDKHSGSKSLKMYRKNKTNANGNVTIPTALTGLAAGTYTVSLWVKGTMGKINLAVLNDAATVASITGAAVSSTTWRQLSMTFTLASASGTITIKVDDLNAGKTYLVKGKKLYIDDIAVQQIDTASVTATVSTKDGYM